MIPLRIKRIRLLVFSIVILLINLSLIAPMIIEKFKEKEDEEIVNNYITSYANVIGGTPRKVEEINKKIKDKYIGVIEIPSINLKRGLVSPYSTSNNVSKNIEIIKPYHMPDEDHKTMILAAHSGTSKVSYFDKLRYIDLYDNVNVYYRDKKYEYKVIDKYQIKKTGKFEMKEYEEKTILALLTCNPTNLNKQIVVICERIN